MEPHPDPLCSWVWAVRGFHAQWFPKGGGVQRFWFGARKQSMRAQFAELAERYEAPLIALAQAAGRRPLVPGGVAHTGFPPRALARLQLQASIFLDQMSRNLAAVRGEQALGLAALRAACDAAALLLALAVVWGCGGPASGAGFLSIGSPPEVCFLSLVLRHSRRQPFIAMSAAVLAALSKELLRVAAGSGARGVAEALELCERFMGETEEAARAVDVEAYLARACSSDEPLALVGPPPPPPPRLAVLDARCQAAHARGAAFLSGLLDESSGVRSKASKLLGVLRASLQSLGLLHRAQGIVLSLSGGVDSMVTNCLLWLLRAQLPPDQRFQWCALHLCHPNRGDAVDEEGWVRWVCDQLGVRLFTYRVGIRRPHGVLRTGISRERYEEKTKELRFRMYGRCLAQLGVESGSALVAHHQDDADENRLAELGKGNILHIDGMAVRGVMQGVEVIRPLLSVRKAELVEFAELAGLCYMQDSTPKWSRRGWTRRLLDGIGAEDPAKHARLLQALTRAGAASEALGVALDDCLRGWVSRGIRPVALAVAACGAAPEGCEGPLQDVPAVVLRLPELLELAGEFEARLVGLCADFADIAAVWNAAIDAQLAEVAAAGGAPPAAGLNGAAAASARADAEGEGDEEGEEEDADAAPKACPLQRIAVVDAPIDVGPFLLGRAISAASNRSPDVQRCLRGQLATRKSLTHLWDCVARARREYQWGALHKRCPCLYLRDSRCLVLCNAEGRDAEFADKAWQRAFAAAALVAAAEGEALGAGAAGAR